MEEVNNMKSDNAIAAQYLFRENRFLKCYNF